jgi:hypothetical protein
VLVRERSNADRRGRRHLTPRCVAQGNKGRTPPSESGRARGRRSGRAALSPPVLGAMPWSPPPGLAPLAYGGHTLPSFARSVTIASSRSTSIARRSSGERAWMRSQNARRASTTRARSSSPERRIAASRSCSASERGGGGAARAPLRRETCPRPRRRSARAWPARGRGNSRKRPPVAHRPRRRLQRRKRAGSDGGPCQPSKRGRAYHGTARQAKATRPGAKVRARRFLSPDAAPNGEPPRSTPLAAGVTPCRASRAP